MSTLNMALSICRLRAIYVALAEAGSVAAGVLHHGGRSVSSMTLNYVSCCIYIVVSMQMHTCVVIAITHKVEAKGVSMIDSMYIRVSPGCNLGVVWASWVSYHISSDCHNTLAARGVRMIVALHIRVSPGYHLDVTWVSY